MESKASRGLKGSRKLPGDRVRGGIVKARNHGISNSGSAVNIPMLVIDDEVPISGSGNAIGNGEVVGTSNGFANGVGGAAYATGISGGNSSAISQLDVAGLIGMGAGLQTSIGSGVGTAGGNSVFGPSLAAAIIAYVPPAPPALVVDTSNNDSKGGGKKGGGSKNGGSNPSVVILEVVAPVAPDFYFVQGLPTGGVAEGFGTGSGATVGTIEDPNKANDDVAPDFYFVQGLPTGGVAGGFGTGSGATVGTIEDPNKANDEASGSGLANGFGFGAGSTVAINNGGEQASGAGGGTAFGQGELNLQVDDIGNVNSTNQGFADFNGQAGAYVGFEPPTPLIGTGPSFAILLP
jgi:hypothetical protein